MPEVLIIIHGKIIIYKKFCSDWRDGGLHLLSQFHYCQIFVYVGIVIGFSILFIIIFLHFVKIKSLKKETFIKSNPCMAFRETKKNSATFN